VKVPDPRDEPKEYGVHDADYIARPVDYIKLPCPTCRTLLYAEPEREGHLITCPDCYTKVKVRRGQQDQSEKPKAAQIGGYQVLEDGAKSKVADDHFLFVCPTCNARLHPSRELVGKRVRCPDCKEVLVVPEPPDRKEQQRPQAVEAYGLEQEGSEPKRLGPEHYFSYFCPRCNARLKALRTSAGEKIDCPDCGVQIRVPDAPEVRVPVGPPAVAQPPAANYERVPAPPMREPIGPDAIEHRIPLAKPPRWTFFSGVFSFPWHGNAIARWGMLSLGLVFAGVLATAGLSLMGGDLIGGFTMAFFGMAVLWLSIWSFSYAAHCMIAIVEDTSAGADEIISWPESDWREWLWHFLHVAYLVAVSIALGFGLSRLAGLWLPLPNLIWALAVFGLFPILLLSSVDADSPFVPLSRRVRRSLPSLAWAWLLVYGLSGLMWTALVATVWALAQINDYLVPLVVGPLLSAVVLIYARLLGRLGWRVAGQKSRRRKNRR
jgi:DNA-directed RNA polymerase subunit RPC12/RpoP